MDSDEDTIGETNGRIPALASRYLTPDQKSLVETVRDLSQERFVSRAARYDADSAFPTENYQDLHEAGLLGLTIPKKYGGLGVDNLTYALCVGEIARGCSATALTFNMHSTILTFIDELGTEEQKQFYFEEVAKNGKLVASITSEPDSSFRDKYVLRTSFTPTDGGFHVEGLKHFCSLGDSADYYFLTGMMEGTSTAKEGLMSALVPRADSGIKVERRWNATGMRGTVSHTIRYDTVVKASQIVGPPGGFLTVDLSRFSLGYAATYLGIAETSFDFIVEYAKSRSLSSSTAAMSEGVVTQSTIAEMGTSIRAAKLLLCETAVVRNTDDTEAKTLATTQAKYLCAEVGVRVTEQAMRLAGGRGFLRDMPLERWHRDALAGPVMPPSNERCLETIGKIYFGLQAANFEFR